MELLASVTTDILQQWAGYAVYLRGQEYQRRGNVLHAGRIGDGMIAAWVRGTRRYATFVEIDEHGVPLSICTCPYGDRCKHAVATVLELRSLANKGVMPTELAESDPRMAILERFDTTQVGDEGEWEEDFADVDDGNFGDDDNEGGDNHDELRAAPPKHVAAKDKWQYHSLPRWVEGLDIAELRDILDTACTKHPELLRNLNTLWRTQHDTPNRAAKAIAREIHEVASQPVWWDRWHDSGSLPDYSGIRAGLSALLKRGEADEVLRLGALLIEKGTQQLVESDDDGETQTEIATALQPVIAALRRSSLSPVEQMLKAFDWGAEDEYSLFNGLEGFWSGRFAKRYWSEFANLLLRRLASLDPVHARSDFRLRYDRDYLTNHIIDALESSGRDDEALELCRSEALESGSYVRFVDALIARKRIDEAEQWIRNGLDASQGWNNGEARQLRERLKELKRRERDWPFVAALILEDFIDCPTIACWSDLRNACEQAGLWTDIRPRVLRILETGNKAPITADDTLPLPSTGLARERESRSHGHPEYAILVRIALDERNVPEIMRLFKAASPLRLGRLQGGTLDDALLNEVAKAVSDAHPDTSVKIWKWLAEQHIAITKPWAYEIAVNHLRLCRDLLKKQKRVAEWSEYFERLLIKEKRKRNFMALALQLKG